MDEEHAGLHIQAGIGGGILDICLHLPPQHLMLRLAQRLLLLRAAACCCRRFARATSAVAARHNGAPRAQQLQLLA